MKNRVKYIIDYYRYTTHSFEQKISVSEGTIRRFLLGKISLKVETILKISTNFPEISLEWLLLNKGEMFRKNEEKPPENIQISNRQCRTVQNNFAKNTVAEPSTEYGNFHATIEALQSTIEAQQHTIEAQQKLIGSLERHIESLERQLSE
jgi:plasmid maintenance system antidote protein VapI